MTSKW